MKNSTNKTVLLVIAVIAGIAIVAVVVFQILTIKNPKLNEALDKIGAHMILPSDEEPTFAVVSDRSKLQGSLKSVAETSDQILVYQKNKLVIVYRPSIDKIVTVMPILLGKEPNTAFNETVAVYNGSGSEEKLQKFIADLYQKYPNTRLIVKESAPRVFPTTTVFSKDNNENIASQLAEGLNIKSGQQPEGVSGKGASITFIVGEDYK